MKKLLVSSLLFLMMGNLSSQNYHYEFSNTCQQAYFKIINLQFDSAQYYIQKEIEQDAENLVPILLQNYHDFIRIIIYEDEPLFEELKTQKKDRLQKWKLGPKNNPWYLSGQAQIKLQWAFSRVLFDEYFTAATEINSAYHLLEENKQLYPDFLADNMGIGILHAMIGVIPDQYQWALEMFGFHGSIEQGVNEIKKQLDEGEDPIFNIEALFYYSFVRLNLQTDSSRYQELLDYYQNERYIKHCQESPLLSFSHAVVLLKMDNDVAIDYLKNLGFDQGQAPFYYHRFLLGQALLYQLNSKSFDYLEDYISNYPGNNYKKSALQRQAWGRFIQGDTLSYQKLMKEILLTGIDLFDADKSAKKEAKASEEGYLPNLYLLRSRMQFDGHYLEGALMELDRMSMDDISQETLLEYHYRKGRIYHEMKSYQKANQSYQSAINEGKNSDQYYAANAALKMGEIAELEEHWAQAEKYYQICLDLDFSEYRRGIRAKAKAGLQRVEKKK